MSENIVFLSSGEAVPDEIAFERAAKSFVDEAQQMSDQDALKIWNKVRGRRNLPPITLDPVKGLVLQ